MQPNEKKAVVYVTGIILVLIFGIALFSVLIDSTLPSYKPGREWTENDFNSFTENFKNRPQRDDFGLFATVISSVNAILFAYLLFNYLSVYFSIKSNFSLGLVVMGGAFLAQSIASNPFVHLFFGFKALGLGPFTIIPTLFTLIIAIVLVFLSRQ